MPKPGKHCFSTQFVIAVTRDLYCFRKVQAEHPSDILHVVEYFFIRCSIGDYVGYCLVYRLTPRYMNATSPMNFDFKSFRYYEWSFCVYFNAAPIAVGPSAHDMDFSPIHLEWSD